MPKLKKLAEKLNCTVEDDRCGTTIWINSNEGWSWENGERSCCCHAYGSGGSYEPEWRQDAIKDAIERLTDEPPDNIKYKY